MLRAASVTQLTNLTSILHQITDEDYSLNLVTLKGASIGKHVRHIAEHYECLLFNSTNGTVNYDSRKRNALLEKNVKYAIDYITEIVDAIDKITSNKRMILTSSYESASINAETSLYRELTHNIEHTVHHLAIISIVIPIHFGYITLLENFGYADSTLQYLKSHKTD